MNYYATLENAKALTASVGWKEHEARLRNRLEQLTMVIESAKSWEEYLDARSRSRELRDALAEVSRTIAVCEAQIAGKSGE